jgi:hypothetical protein
MSSQTLPGPSWIIGYRTRNHLLQDGQQVFLDTGAGHPNIHQGVMWVKFEIVQTFILLWGIHQFRFSIGGQNSNLCLKTTALLVQSDSRIASGVPTQKLVVSVDRFDRVNTSSEMWGTIRPHPLAPSNISSTAKIQHKSVATSAM